MGVEENACFNKRTFNFTVDESVSLDKTKKE